VSGLPTQAPPIPLSSLAKASHRPPQMQAPLGEGGLDCARRDRAHPSARAARGGRAPGAANALFARASIGTARTDAPVSATIAAAPVACVLHLVGGGSAGGRIALAIGVGHRGRGRAVGRLGAFSLGKPQCVGLVVREMGGQVEGEQMGTRAEGKIGEWRRRRR